MAAAQGRVATGDDHASLKNVATRSAKPVVGKREIWAAYNARKAQAAAVTWWS